MSYISIFMQGFMFENLLTFYAVGLGMLVLFTYKLSEALWVCLRVNIFLCVQTLILIFVSPYFNIPGKEVFIILFMLGVEILISIGINLLFPQSRLDKGVYGITKRGDAIMPMVLAVLLTKNQPMVDTLVYSLGLGLGFAVILIAFTTLSLKLSFHRLALSKVYALKFFILGVLAIFFG